MQERGLTLEQAEKIMSENDRNLDLNYSIITELPNNLTIGDYLDFSETSITKLSDNLTVGGDIFY